MRTAKKAPIYILIVLMILMLLPQQALATDYGVSNPAELTSALSSAASGDTIRLTADINYTAGIVISGKTITFDLNGHTLNVANDTGSALEVGSGGVVNLTGSGAFNVTSSATDCYGVDAQNGGQATVTNATATGTRGVGAHAIGTGSYVQVTGSATSADNIGALARNEGTVTVGGNAEGVTGADAVGTNTLVEVAGNITGNKGVACAMGATVRVNGNVNATGNCADPRAIAIVYSGTVIVGGNVTASATGTVGVWIYDGGTATIDGTLIAPVYIELQEIAKTVADGVQGTAPYENYLIYTDGTNTVRVGLLASAAIDPAASFDKNPSGQADVSAAITWNNAKSVTDVKANGASIGAENYSVSGNTLTIKKDYLASRAVGNLVLAIEFDTGNPATLTIAISDSTPESAVISPASAAFDRNLANQADVSITVTWNDATSVTGVKAGGASIGAGNYSVSGNTLTIKKEYLAAQAAGNLVLTIEFNIGGPVMLTIAVNDTTPITGLPDELTLYVGGRITWNPSPEGGTWNWDEEYFSAAFNSPATFTALKAGISAITYTVNGVSQSVTVTIRESELPQTGQNDTLLWVLLSLAALCGGSAIMLPLAAKRRKAR